MNSKTPIEKASQFKVGTKCKGETDLYIVEKTKNNIKRWIKYNSNFFIVTNFKDKKDNDKFWKWVEKLASKYKWKWIGGAAMAIGYENQLHGYYKNRNTLIKLIKNEIKKRNITRIKIFKSFTPLWEAEKKINPNI